MLTVDTKYPLTKIHTFSIPVYLFQEEICLFLMVSVTLLMTYFGGINNYIQMNIIFLLGSYLYIIPIRIIFYKFLAALFQVTPYFCDQNLSPVSGNPYDMILCFVYPMGCFV